MSDTTSETVPKPPPLTIVLLVVGTFGDLQPFLLIGLRLKKDGHRVRLASHPEYRSLIVDKHKLEFYPLGGNPRKLSALLVKTGGWLVPNAFSEDDMAWLNMSFEMIGDIMRSTWPACTAPDPDDPKQKPFKTQAILANPVAYGYLQCAEKLDVPLQLYFLQPWTPTNSFPHPFSNLPYKLKNASVNRLSYYAVDGFFWRMGMRTHTEAFRKELGLPPMSDFFDFGLESTKNVPFGYLWSEELVPTPSDWGPNIDVCGSIFDLNYDKFTPSLELQSFLEGAVSGTTCQVLERIGSDGEVEEATPKEVKKIVKPPVFIGFGSMVIEEGKVLDNMLRAICNAAIATNTRVLVQSSWATFDVKLSSDLVYVLSERVPHHWLFQRCSAVIHHGGASTTSMGLRCGKPTMICPFFGDQFFWAQKVVDAGVGVPPCNALKLTAEVLCDRFEALKGKEIVQKAKAMGKLLSKEDGVTGAVNTFYRQWAIDQGWRRAADEVRVELEEEDRINALEEEARAIAKEAAKVERAKRLEKYSLSKLLPDMPELPDMPDMPNMPDMPDMPDIQNLNITMPNLFSSFSDEGPAEEETTPLPPPAPTAAEEVSPPDVKPTTTRRGSATTKKSTPSPTKKVNNGLNSKGGKAVKAKEVVKPKAVVERQSSEGPLSFDSMPSFDMGNDKMPSFDMASGPLGWLASAQEERPDWMPTLGKYTGPEAAERT